MPGRAGDGKRNQRARMQFVELRPVPWGLENC